MKVPAILFAVHVMAILFGLIGLLVILPHPALWSGNPTLAHIFPLGMSHGGELQMVLGALTILTFGLHAVGPRRTLIFAVVGTLMPLGAELLGTATGWPFGGYAYTNNLGYKVAGRVPYSVPLSWFYMGFASFLLGSVIAAQVCRRRPRARVPLSVLLGAWLLTAWDLVLDPAMASPAMPVRFWVWHEAGPYFGMPLRNLVGWFGTGLAFMVVARLLWRQDGVTPRLKKAWIPLGVYTANTVWAMALSLSVGLWQTVDATVILGLAPALLVLWSESDGSRISLAVGGDRADSATRSSLAGP